MSSWKVVSDWFNGCGTKYTTSNSTTKVVVEQHPISKAIFPNVDIQSFTYPPSHYDGRSYDDLKDPFWASKYKHNLDYSMGVSGPQGSTKYQTSAAYFSQTDLNKENQTLKNRIQVLEDKNAYLLKKNINIESALADALKLIEKFVEKNKFVNSLIKKIEELLIEEEENENNSI